MTKKITDMRATLKAKVGKFTVLDALTACFDMPPTDRHQRQARDFGGLNDPQTIASIPEQAMAIRRILFAAYPFIHLTDADLFPLIDVRSFNHRQMINRDTGHLYNTVVNQNGRTWLDRSGVSIAPTHPVVGFYIHYLGRAPDKDGFEFWVEQYEAKHVPLNVVEDLFRTSEEARALLEHAA